MPKSVLLTGYRGFIGQAVLHELEMRGHVVYGVDAETYAAQPGARSPAQWRRLDINDLEHLPAEVDVILNLAAETHVDNAITDPGRFLRSNTLGVHHLLALLAGRGGYRSPRFVQVSTDEVYGDGYTDTVDEEAALRPSNPYAASKAAADLFLEAHHRTYGTPYQIIRPSNCYGPGQYPEKLIPKAVRCLHLRKRIPVHGDGQQVRTWLHVDDAARAIVDIVERGEENLAYNLCGDTTCSVLVVVNAVVEAWNTQQGTHRRLDQVVEFHRVRPGMDRRYRVSDARVRMLGWQPEHRLFDSLATLLPLELSRSAAERW